MLHEGGGSREQVSDVVLFAWEQVMSVTRVHYIYRYRGGSPQRGRYRGGSPHLPCLRSFTTRTKEMIAIEVMDPNQFIVSLLHGP